MTRFREEKYLADLTANNIQYDKFPFATWAKIMRQALTDYDTSLLKTVPFNGVEKLRVAIAEHLYRYRSMEVSPDHIIVGRRQELLRWAAEEPERYIVEDDFDCEFRMVAKPVPSMQSMDRNHRVIYINTFSKTMVPSLRIGYMVLPEKLMERYISTMNFYSCTVSGFEQYAMAAFLEQGYFERHIRRLINDYRGQRERICRMFRESRLHQISHIYQDDAGTHFLLHVRTDLSDVEIKWAARQQGILVNCLSEYCFADAQKYRGILVIHYSDMEDEVLQKVIGALEEIFL